MPKNKRGKFGYSKGGRRTQSDNAKRGMRNGSDYRAKDDAQSTADNDVSWYTKYPNLLVAAGSFPYPYRPGMLINVGKALVNSTGTTYTQETLKVGVPGVMELRWMPSFGVSNSPTDPASIMAKEMYARVRAAFSGSLAADAPDYVVYLGALDSVFSYLAWIKRVYRVLNAYTPENYVLPDTVLRAMGFTDAMVATMRANKTQFWQIINELVLYSRKFTCPAVMDLMNRHYWMNDNVYTDANTLSSQMYLFNQWGFYKFAMLNMPDGNPGPGLQMVLNPIANVAAKDFSLTTLYQFGRDLIDALVEWDDAYTISGYLRRAYEGAAAFVVDEIPAVTMFTPAYSEEVLAQIENSRTIPYGAQAYSATNLPKFNLTQNVATNAVISNPQYVVSADPANPGTNVVATGSAEMNPMINSRSMAPTVADSVIASRLQGIVEVIYDSTNKRATLTVSAGTEIPLEWRIYKGYSSSYSAVPSIAQVTPTTGIGTLISLYEMEQFDWHPITYLVYSNPTNFEGEGGVWVFPVGDVHNITTVSPDNLRNLHKICVYSELNAFNQ